MSTYILIMTMLMTGDRSLAVGIDHVSGLSHKACTSIGSAWAEKAKTMEKYTRDESFFICRIDGKEKGE